MFQRTINCFFYYSLLSFRTIPILKMTMGCRPVFLSVTYFFIIYYAFLWSYDTISSTSSCLQCQQNRPGGGKSTRRLERSMRSTTPNTVPPVAWN